MTTSGRKRSVQTDKQLTRLAEAVNRKIGEKAKAGPPREPTSFYELDLVPRG